MARFGRGDIVAARTFVDSVYSRGGALTGRGARHPSTWSDTYTLRVANAWQRSAAAGRPLSLQEARRGRTFVERVRTERLAAERLGKRLPGGLEHPRERWVGPLVGKRPDEEGSAGFYARQYRRGRSAADFVAKLHADRVQVIAYGQLAAGYSGATLAKQWRVLYTGPRDGAVDDFPMMQSGMHGNDASGNGGVVVFDSIERFEVRHGPGVG